MNSQHDQILSLTNHYMSGRVRYQLFSPPPSRQKKKREKEKMQRRSHSNNGPFTQLKKHGRPRGGKEERGEAKKVLLRESVLVQTEHKLKSER